MNTSLETEAVKTRAETVSEIELFRHSARTVHKVVQLNVDGLTQSDSLIQPSPAGNCLNWVAGHLLLRLRKCAAAAGAKTGNGRGDTQALRSWQCSDQEGRRRHGAFRNYDCMG